MNIPKSWDEISLSQYLELVNLKPNEFESEIDYNLERLCILTNTSNDDKHWEDMDYSEMVDLLGKIKFINNQPNVNKYKTNIDSLYLKNFESMTLGEFIDAEFFYDNLQKFLAIFYRYKKIDEFGNESFEKYSDINLDLRANKLLEHPVTYYYGLINNYLKFRAGIYDRYQGLFDFNNDEETDTINEEKLIEKNPELKNEIEEGKKIEEQQKKWGWERILYYLANDDITKIDSILSLNLYFVLNMLSMKKELNI